MAVPREKKSRMIILKQILRKSDLTVPETWIGEWCIKYRE